MLDNYRHGHGSGSSSSQSLSSRPESGTSVPEGQLIDFASEDGRHLLPQYHLNDSASFSTNEDQDEDEGEDEDGDNISLGSVDTDLGPNALPPTYDLAAILNNSQASTVATAPRNGFSAASSLQLGNTPRTTNFAPGSHPSSGPLTGAIPPGRIPVNVPSTAEMENLPNDVVALILETLTILELFDLHSLSDRWRQLTTRALLDKFTLSNVVLWIDQEGHRTFRPVFLFDSFDEATNRIRWLPKHMPKPENRGQVYSKTFGITKPMIRIISVGDVDQYDYLDKEAHISILRQGTRTLLGTDKGCPWAMIYKVSSFTRKGKKIDGERWIEPLSFECHLDFLNPRRAHKLRLLWYLQKSYSNMPIVGAAAQKHVNRSKVEGAIPAQQMSEFFSGSSRQQQAMHTLPTFR